MSRTLKHEGDTPYSNENLYGKTSHICKKVKETQNEQECKILGRHRTRNHVHTVDFNHHEEIRVNVLAK